MLGAVLREALGSSATVAPDATGRLEIRYDGGSALLIPLWAGAGWPSDVERLRRSPQWESAADQGVRVVVGKQYSAAVRESLSEEGIAWADESGAAAIDLPGLIIRLGDRARLDATNKRPDDPAPRWSPAVGLLTEALLAPFAGRSDAVGGALPKIAELAEVTGISGPFISRTLRAFDAARWTSKSGGDRGTGTVRTLVDPGSLLSAWAEWYPASRPEPIGAHAIIRDADAWVATTAHAWPAGSWALTGGLVLEARAPFLTSVPTIELYLDQDVCLDPDRRAKAFAAAGLRQVDSGARVNVYPSSPAALALMRRSAWWTSVRPEVGAIRLYGDLLASPAVRGGEAADHLRRTRIGF